MDLDDLDDPALKAAIEASLQDVQIRTNSGDLSSRNPQGRGGFVDLTADSDNDSEVQELFPKSKSVVGSETDNEAEQEGEDEELKRALALSMEGITQKDDVSEVSPVTAVSPTTSSIFQGKSKPSTSLGIFGLNRKQMEEERLARLAKRKAENGVSPPPSQPALKAPKLDLPQRAHSATSNSSFGASSQTVGPLGNVCNHPATNSPQTNIRPTSIPVIQWPFGAVKKTVVPKFPRQGNDITVEEVLQRHDLELAVLSSFLWDMEWLFSKLETRKTRFLLVMQAKDQLTKNQYKQETADMPNLRLCFPPMDGAYGQSHFNRLGENNLMENSVFLIDLPKKTQDGPDDSTDFYEDLVYFLRASTVDEGVIAKLDNFDFSKTARYAFVHTIGGATNPGESWRRTGYSGLGRAVTRLGLRSFSPINIDFITSSVGSLNDGFLRAIYLACKGDDGLTEYNMRNTRASAARNQPETQKEMMLNISQEWRSRFHVYFPSDSTVRSSHTRPELTAGTICFQSKWWEGEKFPRHVMRDCESERGVLMHNKIIFVWPSEPIMMPNDTQCKGWAYVGSANLSESAWGRLVKDRATGQPKMNCRNWECGVIVPVTNPTPSANEAQRQRQQQSEELKNDQAPHDLPQREPKPGHLPAEIFRDIVPVPMNLPAAELRDGREPWFFMG
ncbi:hypothetical protein NUU61_007230 [Penicillium alfredii]|uniref:PLD phosphodiesterase domain-containing protein n=1 Tax=Penicillium alfredii TaxID=1506179 RepID=A0A9W9F2E8_9EURO|nr:uncharacterized protein NUU61_007230 [Penicillium alfredii]KAJ5092360.1 hypothetical protein NUU61_007230 [Penicillium alfredii]